jgi:hypothetical protein
MGAKIKLEMRWNMNNKKTSDIIIIISVITAIISGYVSMTQTDIFRLAGTQWMLIAIILGIYGLYMKLKQPIN